MIVSIETMTDYVIIALESFIHVASGFGMDFYNPLQKIRDLFKENISVSVILQTMDLLRRYDNQTFMSCKKLCVNHDKKKTREVCLSKI